MFQAGLASLVSVLALGGVACEGADEPKAQAETTVCGAICARAVRCNISACEQECSQKGLTSDRESHWKPAFIAGVTSCLSRLACGPNESACFEHVFAQMEPQYQGAADIQRCLDKRTSCGGEWADDLCYSMVALNPDDRVASDDCSQTAECSQYKACRAPHGGFYY